MTWGLILVYAALLAVIAWPMAAVSRVAGAVCIVFVAAFALVNGLGTDQVWTYFVLHLFAFWLTFVTWRTAPGLIASVMFAPMAVVDGLRLAGIITEYRWACGTYFAGLLQLALLAGMIDRAAVLTGPRNWITQIRDLWMRFVAPGMA